MPVYEFRCQACGAKATLLMALSEDPADQACPSCGEKQLQKLISRFRRGRSEDERVEEISDRIDLYGEPDSATAVRNFAREVGKAMDDDLSDEMEEMFEADQEGEPE